MKKTALRIKIVGDPVLRKKAKRVETVTDRHRQILNEMATVMRNSRGIGLAGPQVGINDSLIVVDVGSGLYKLINPCITAKEGEQIVEEGCLSVPGVYVKMKRAQRVVVEGIDENAQPQKIVADDLLACVFQHEIDHLHGRLICDYVSVKKKIEIECMIKEYLKNKAEDIPEQKKKPQEL
jgi:peptide deformylase